VGLWAAKIPSRVNIRTMDPNPVRGWRDRAVCRARNWRNFTTRLKARS
jgi:hypothetical protein